MSAATDRSWFHPAITGHQAEQLLKTEGKVGSFLVRSSASEVDSYRLSVRLSDTVTHLRVYNDGECYDLHGSGGETFASLPDLVRFYMEGGPGFGSLKEKSGTKIELRFPLPSSDHSTERFFHRDMSGEDAKDLLLQFKPGWFLVRTSKTKMDSFVLSVRTEDENSEVMHVMISRPGGRFTIGDGSTFPSLAQLVNAYRTKAITDKDGISVKLKQAVDVTSFRVCDIGLRVAQLEKVFEVNEEKRDGFWEEFEHLQSQEDTCSQQFDAGRLPENKKKNRYKNILPFDHSRVILKDVDTTVPGSDYINANYVTVDTGVNAKRPRTYIAAQGCMQNTITDFWSMVWQEKCTVITMLTALTETGKLKCVQYWPDDSAGSMTLEVHNAKLILEPVSSRHDCRDWMLRTFILKKVSSKGKTEGPRTIYHYHFLEWPDKKVPTSSDAGCVIDFLQKVNNRWMDTSFAGPLIVHCSAGIGRTGTYIAIDMLINHIETLGENCRIDVSQTIQAMRQYRPGLVQVWHQYRFIYIAIKRFVEYKRSQATARKDAPSVELYANWNSTPATKAAPSGSASGEQLRKSKQRVSPADVEGSTVAKDDKRLTVRAAPARLPSRNSVSQYGSCQPQAEQAGENLTYQNFEDAMAGRLPKPPPPRAKTSHTLPR